MRSTQNLSTATPDTIRQQMFQTVEHLLRAIHRNQHVLEELQQVRDLLDSLPLATSEYGTAANRLRNAHRYLVSQERGAARYELQMLAGMLRPDVTRSVTHVGHRMRRSHDSC